MYEALYNLLIEGFMQEQPPRKLSGATRAYRNWTSKSRKMSGKVTSDATWQKVANRVRQSLHMMQTDPKRDKQRAKRNRTKK